MTQPVSRSGSSLQIRRKHSLVSAIKTKPIQRNSQQRPVPLQRQTPQAPDERSPKRTDCKNNYKRQKNWRLENPAGKKSARSAIRRIARDTRRKSGCLTHLDFRQQTVNNRVHANKRAEISGRAVAFNACFRVRFRQGTLANTIATITALRNKRIARTLRLVQTATLATYSDFLLRVGSCTSANDASKGT